MFDVLSYLETDCIVSEGMYSLKLQTFCFKKQYTTESQITKLPRIIPVSSRPDLTDY